MPDFSQMLLGKKPARHDPRTLKLANYVNPAALPPIPAQRAWDDGFSDWGLKGNDRYGDCVEAGMAHAQQVLAVNNGKQIVIADADVLNVYAAITGFNPLTGANDNGTAMLDAMKFWKNVGIDGHTIGAFASVDPTNTALVQAAIDLFGFVIIGVLLPMSAQSQSSSAGLWDVPPGGPTGNGAPASWGGHCVVLPDYNNQYKAITWGYLQPVSQAFIHTYCDEMYAVLSPDWFAPNAKAPSGFDLPTLTRDLAIVSGSPDPGPPPFVPDAYATAAFGWQKTVADYLVGAYAGGDVTDADAWQGTLAGFCGPFAAYLQGKAPAPQMPKLPGGV